MLTQDVADQRHRSDVVEREHFRPQPVVDVVGIVGDVVGDRAGLRLRARIGPQFEVVGTAVFGDAARQLAFAVPLDRDPGAVGQRAVVLHQPFQRLEGEIEAVEARIGPLQRRHHPQGLRVVVEAAERREAMVERALAGVAERRMAEIVAERRALREVLVEAERAGERTRDLRDLQRVGQPGAEMVALVKHEDLGLVGETAKRRGMDDAVAIAAERAARAARRLRIAPAAAVAHIGGKGCGHFDRLGWAWLCPIDVAGRRT